MKPGEPLCCAHLLHKRLLALNSPHPYLRLAAALWVCTPIALRQACCSHSKIHHKDPRGRSRTINWGNLQGDLLGSLSVSSALKHPKDPNKPVLGFYAIFSWLTHRDCVKSNDLCTWFRRRYMGFLTGVPVSQMLKYTHWGTWGP